MTPANPPSSPVPKSIQDNGCVEDRSKGSCASRVPLLLLVCLSFIRGLLYVSLVPPWGHYDEPTHFEYVWLIANRLSDPHSEHGLARWLENTYVCDRQGRRWAPDWKPLKEITREQRVRVEHRQLNIWYRTLDALLAGKEAIEKDLYFRVRDLFHMEVDMVLYDMTNTYFKQKQFYRQSYTKSAKVT